MVECVRLVSCSLRHWHKKRCGSDTTPYQPAELRQQVTSLIHHRGIARFLCLGQWQVGIAGATSSNRFASHKDLDSAIESGSDGFIRRALDFWGQPGE